MTKSYRFIFACALIAYFVFCSFIINSEEKKRICKSVELSYLENPENKLVTKEAINSILSKKNIQVINMDWKDIEVAKIEKIIEKHPVVKKMACIRKPNDQFVIKILQYIPSFRVISSQESYYVSESKTIIPTDCVGAALVIVASGSISRDYAVNTLYPLIHYINNDVFLKSQIVQIFVTKKQELFLVPRVGKQQINFGKADNFQRKFTNLKVLYKQGFSKVGWDKYKCINLKYENQVVCTRID